MAEEVTDPDLLKQLESPSGPQEVTDAGLLAQLEGSQERGVWQRAGEAAYETGAAGLSAAKRLFVPPEDVSGYRGASGILRSLKETGAGILGPLTTLLGAPVAGAESLAASGLGATQRGLERGIAAGVEQVSPETGERLRARIPTSEQAYEAARPFVGAALQAVGARGAAPGTARAAPTMPARPETPIVPKGPEAEAGKVLREAAIDPTAVEARLAQPVTEIVPGSQPTTYQLTGDLGLGQLERAAETRSQHLFQQRRAEQNQARLQAIEEIQRTGSPEDVSDHLRNILRSYDAGIEGDYKIAQQRAWEAAQQVGGTYDPATYGNVLRRELHNAEEAARANERALWQRVDPNGDLVASAMPMQELERSIYGRMTAAGGMTITPAERSIAELIQNYPGVVPFREMTDLRSLVSSSMREELATRGRTPAYARLVQLRTGIEDAVTNRVLDLQQGQFVQSAAERLREASAATRERAGRFNISPIRDVLRREGLEGPYKVQESGVPGRLIKPGLAGYDTSSAYLRAVGNREGLPVLQDAVAADMRRSVVGTDGLVDSKKLTSWMNRHQDMLRAIDERDGGAFSQRLRNAGDASDVLAEVAQRRATVADHVARSEFGKLVGATDATDISRIIGGIFGGQQSVQKSRSLSRLLTTPEAREGAQRAIVDFIRDKFVSNMEAGTTGQNIIRADQFQTFVRRNRVALSEFMSPEQISGLEAIAADLRRMNRSLQTKVRGGSNTMQDAMLLTKYEQASILGRLLSMGLRSHIPFTREGFVFLLNLRKAARDAGIRRVQDLVDVAMLDPNVARDLLKSAKGSPKVSGLKRWALYDTAVGEAEQTRKGKPQNWPAPAFNFKAGGRVPVSLKMRLGPEARRG